MLTIYITSNQADLEWLAWCLKSIDKFVYQKCDVIVELAMPAKDVPNFQLHNHNLKIATCNPWSNDYIGQQWRKLTFANRFNVKSTSQILFMDSDCIFTRRMSEYEPQTWPWYYTRYELVGDAICWKQPTEKFRKKQVDFEFMRRLPLSVKAVSLKAFVEDYRGATRLRKYMEKQDRFSEFNALGSWLFDCDTSIAFANTEIVPDLYDNPVKQFWSHAIRQEGFEPIRAEIEAILNG
jgi:hypothetical protein